MPEDIKSLQILQVVFGAVLVIFGMMMLFFMQSQSIIILYIAAALLCFKDGLTMLLAAIVNLTQKD